MSMHDFGASHTLSFADFHIDDEAIAKFELDGASEPQAAAGGPGNQQRQQMPPGRT